jgi:hypothetical protein
VPKSALEIASKKKSALEMQRKFFKSHLSILEAMIKSCGGMKYKKDI